VVEHKQSCKGPRGRQRTPPAEHGPIASSTATQKEHRRCQLDEGKPVQQIVVRDVRCDPNKDWKYAKRVKEPQRDVQADNHLHSQLCDGVPRSRYAKRLLPTGGSSWAIPYGIPPRRFCSRQLACVVYLMIRLVREVYSSASSAK
jgi:hypothetical protein